MGDLQNTNGSDERPDVVSEFDQTNGLADGIYGDDDGALEPAERDSVFEDAMCSIGDSRLDDADADGVTSYREEGRS